MPSNQMKYINTTPHDINLMLETGNVVIPPSGLSFRVAADSEVVRTEQIEGHAVEVRARVFRDVIVFDGEEEVPLPDEQEGVFYIVSRITAEALPERTDLRMVDGTVRDESGRIIGCTGLSVL